MLYLRTSVGWALTLNSELVNNSSPFVFEVFPASERLVKEFEGKLGRGSI